MINPTIGRVVWYYRHGKTQFDANEQAEAAIIAYVHSETMVNLLVIDPDAVQHTRNSVFLYQGEGDRPDTAYAEWMPFQIGQAKAAVGK